MKKLVFILMAMITIVVSSCMESKQVPVISVQDDFEIVEDTTGRVVKDSVYYLITIKDSKTGKTKGYISIVRDTLTDRKGKEGL